VALLLVAILRIKVAGENTFTTEDTKDTEAEKRRRCPE
jgi:hypothetical protein